jgi:hypothetical protein
MLGSGMLYVAKAKQLWPLFLWPFLALLSVMWSFAPGSRRRTLLDVPPDRQSEQDAPK